MARVNQLSRFLADNGGRATFWQFMAAALYHPEFGYYTNNIRAIGRGGDFSTSATLAPLLARAVARWLVEYGTLTLGCGALNIIEIGPGTGELALMVRKFLPLTARWCARWHLVEISPVLRERQRALLGNQARWHDSVSAALQACDGRALIYSNELVDAFPCIQLVKHGDDWREISLELVEGALTERGGPVRSAFRREHFSVFSYLRQAADGQRCELQESYRAWQSEWLPLWCQGAMLTVDYGDTTDCLYLRRPRGSLRAYFQHNALEGVEVYQRMGRQDLTVDVNFTDLENWGLVGGLRTEFFQTQADFIQQRVKSAGSDAEKMLLHPDGAGRVFKVLCQSRGI